VDAVRFGQLEESVEQQTEFVLGDMGALHPYGFGLVVSMLENWTAEWDQKMRQFYAVEHFEPRTVTIEVATSKELAEAEDAKAKVETVGKRGGATPVVVAPVEEIA
jgi:hypothetical protein